jgi:invasion protein IalB
MSRLITRPQVALALLLASAAPAVAQQPAQPASQAPKKTPDPNEIVCEKQHDTGSRLTMHKVCMTRSEWAEQRRLNRQDIEKIQVQRPMSN